MSRIVVILPIVLFLQNGKVIIFNVFIFKKTFVVERYRIVQF